jgi:hypothetical protein
MYQYKNIPLSNYSLSTSETTQYFSWSTLGSFTIFSPTQLVYLGSTQLVYLGFSKVYYHSRRHVPIGKLKYVNTYPITSCVNTVRHHVILLYLYFNIILALLHVLKILCEIMTRNLTFDLKSSY